MQMQPEKLSIQMVGCMLFEIISYSLRHSGDLATMCEEGYIKIVGRIKDLIIRGGENMY